MTEIELFEFVAKFNNLLNAGKKARLVIECENSQAYVNLEVKLGHSHQHHGERHFRRDQRAGPSRLRRRERREQARLTAAEQAGPHPHHGAVPHNGCAHHSPTPSHS